MLVQSGKRAYRDSEREDFYNGLANGYRVAIKGSIHHAFMDETMLPLAEDRRQALVGGIAGPRMVHMTSLLVCSFFDIYLRMEPSGLLRNVSSQFPEITIQTSSVNEGGTHAQ